MTKSKKVKADTLEKIWDELPERERADVATDMKEKLPPGVTIENRLRYIIRKIHARTPNMKANAVPERFKPSLSPQELLGKDSLSVLWKELSAREIDQVFEDLNEPRIVGMTVTQRFDAVVRKIHLRMVPRRSEGPVSVKKEKVVNKEDAVNKENAVNKKNAVNKESVVMKENPLNTSVAMSQGARHAATPTDNIQQQLMSRQQKELARVNGAMLSRNEATQVHVPIAYDSQPAAGHLSNGLPVVSEQSIQQLIDSIAGPKEPSSHHSVDHDSVKAVLKYEKEDEDEDMGFELPMQQQMTVAHATGNGTRPDDMFQNDEPRRPVPAESAFASSSSASVPAQVSFPAVPSTISKRKADDQATPSNPEKKMKKDEDTTMATTLRGMASFSLVPHPRDSSSSSLSSASKRDDASKTPKFATGANQEALGDGSVGWRSSSAQASPPAATVAGLHPPSSSLLPPAPTGEGAPVQKAYPGPEQLQSKQKDPFKPRCRFCGDLIVPSEQQISGKNQIKLSCVRHQSKSSSYTNWGALGLLK